MDCLQVVEQYANAHSRAAVCLCYEAQRGQCNRTTVIVFLSKLRQSSDINVNLGHETVGFLNDSNVSTCLMETIGVVTTIRRVHNWIKDHSF